MHQCAKHRLDATVRVCVPELCFAGQGDVGLATGLVEDEQADVFLEVVGREGVARVVAGEERVERWEVRRPVGTENCHVDAEYVGAARKQVEAVRGGDCFAEFAQRGEDSGQFLGRGGGGRSGFTSGAGAGAGAGVGRWLEG